jgi:hypothetical protein
LKLVDSGLRCVTQSRRKILDKIVNDPRKINLLLSVLSRNGVGLMNLGYDRQTGLFRIGTDMDYKTSQQIIEENNLEYVVLQPVVTENNFCTYLVFEAPHYPEAVALIDAYIEHFKKK